MSLAARMNMQMLRSCRRTGAGPLAILGPGAFALGGSLGVAALLLAWAAAKAIAPRVALPDFAAGRTKLALRTDVVAALDVALRRGAPTAALVIEIDRFRQIEAEHDRAAIETLLRVTEDRLGQALLGAGTPARLEGPAFAVALEPAGDLDLEAALQMAGRVQRTLSEPVALGDANLQPTLSLGLALPRRLPSPTGEALLRAATVALIEAQRSGPAAIRSYSEAMRARVETRGALVQEVAHAFERGEIRGHFQPQLSARDGTLTGFETLARWQHPIRGLIPPAEFLPAIEQAGQMIRLGEVMLREALTALRDWESQGLHVPRVGVNFSSAELCDPRLLDRIGWELDRFDLTPDRLVVEVLETVVASRSDDMVVRNLAGLARLGCCLDLDDFGTGHASITSIRRLSIERIKIDRSFVTRIDEDPEQQRMVAAILTMADRLGIDTLAEGVETPEERAMLEQLGCGHLQGFGIARPMPFVETIGWIASRGAAEAQVLRRVG
ncbi:putative bifunctional diguanylate cyclase/phosphodiesterase [Rubellimicrobium roseum]|uniref:EAL domain-containing protein n=1 Tax=Rubellimicrobium roseum TaxID=687525 RepID=A0A5C4N8P4_9RHOB|nr:GGDEF domain-containing phosphodiesterase [Rubellimicrobium roseum]TNC65158.1 EAL domain-containing protein [Rubellimicrobium roseum]